MSSSKKKRSHADRQDDNATKPPTKKARYSYDYHKQQQQQSQSQSQQAASSRLPRTATNSDDETVSDTDRETLVLPSTISTPKLPSLHSAIPKHAQIPHQSMEELLKTPWCAADWFKTRIACNDAEEFIKMLPWDESKAVMQQLVKYRGSALTVIFNLLRTLYTMDKIRKKYKAYSRGVDRKKHGSNLYASHQKKKASKSLKQMNQILSMNHNNHFGVDICSEIDKMQHDLRRLQGEVHEYHRLETARKALYNERDTEEESEDDDDLLVLSSKTDADSHLNTKSKSDKSRQSAQHTHRHGMEDDTEISSCDRESDEDYVADDNNDGGGGHKHKKRHKKHKKRKRERKKNKKNNKKRKSKWRDDEEEEEGVAVTAYPPPSTAAAGTAEETALYYQAAEGKNPQQTATDHRKFWSQFRAYFEPIPPGQDAWDSLAPLLHIDAFPVEIPALPSKNNLNVDALHDATADSLLSSFEHDLSTTTTNSNTNSKKKEEEEEEVQQEDADLYFAEMPKQYEYFHGEKHYVTEQQHLESQEARKELARDALHQDFPQKSLFGHSFDQRVLSCMVHACRGMYDIEAQHGSGSRVHENDWREIGDAQFAINDVSNERAAHGKRWNKHKHGGEHHHDEEEAFQPVIRYKTVMASSSSTQPEDEGEEAEQGKLNGAPTTSSKKRKPFEQTLRDLICKHYFEGDANAFAKIVAKSWSERTDDEVCATIKSLQNNMQWECNDYAYNGIEHNVKMANQIFDIVSSEIEHQHYLAWHQFKSHSEHIRHLANRQMNDSNYVVATDTLLMPHFTDDLTKKQPPLQTLQHAANALMPSKRVQCEQHDRHHLGDNTPPKL